MSLIQPRTPPGTLELLPRDQMTFQHMLDVIRRGYERFGFVNIETPVFELCDVLLTKSGGETEKQVYFVQKTGSIKQGYAPELALRFDLTVPLARYVAEHERDLAFPFRRYQIQRSYRGERPQKGRQCELYQCDIDIIGKDKLSPAFDAELPAIAIDIFRELGIPDFTIHFSNRKLLLGLLPALGIEDAEKQTLIVREIDKMDKIGLDGVTKSLSLLGLDGKTIEKLLRLITLTGSNEEILTALREDGVDHPVYAEGLEELTNLVAAMKALGVPEGKTRLNPSITRGLDYYTGVVYETKLNDASISGSTIAAGGRYENLASHYTKSKLPGVGFSIGASRIFDLLYNDGHLPKAKHTVDVLITQLEPERAMDYLALATELRKAGFNVENYLEPAKLEKQLKYADKSGVPLAILFGTTEAAKDIVMVKDLARKEQIEVARKDLPAKLRELLNR